MTSERALEIVKAINDRCLFTMDLVDKVGSLKDVMLAEMVEAAGIVRTLNASAEYIEGKKTISLVPDDRLIAAAYCLEHYPPSREAIVVIPASRQEAFWHEGDRKALAVVVIDSNAASSEEEDEEAA